MSSRLFVAVAGLGLPTAIINTSPDGTTWTARAAPSVAAWTDVVYSPELGLFCMVAGGPSTTSNKAATSPDGITWTAQTLPATQNWSAIRWIGNKFVAVASGGVTSAPTAVCATSPDGVNWTSRTMASTQSWSALSWNGAVLVAVATNTSVGAGHPTNIVNTSLDGITWAAHTMASTAKWGAVAWNGTRFVALSGVDAASTVTNYSSDGVTWTAGTIASGVWVALASSGSILCALSVGATSATSPDGITWTTHLSMTFSGNWSAIAWNGLVFAAVNANGTTANISADGNLWVAHSLTNVLQWAGITSSFATPSGLPPPDWTITPQLNWSAPAFPNAFPVGWRTIRFLLAIAPDFVTSTSGRGDALNPATWGVLAQDTGAALTPLMVTQVDATTFDVTFQERLESHLFKQTVSAFGIVIGGIAYTFSFTVLGMTWAEDYTTERRSAQKRQVARDLANPPTLRVGSSGLGGTLVVRGGDYATVTGIALVKKLILRRLMTAPGSFFHLPNYGLGLLSAKDLFRPGDLVKLQAEVERQVRLEPEVNRCVATVVVDARGIVYVSVTANTVGGEEIQVSANSGKVA